MPKILLRTFSTLPTQPTKIVYKKQSNFSSSLFGFSFGLVVSGLTGYWFLMNEFQKQSSALFLSVDQLSRQLSTFKVQMNKLDKLEKQIKEQHDESVQKKQFETVKEEFKDAINTLHIELLKLRSEIDQK